MTPRHKTAERVCALVRQGLSLRDIAGRPRMPSLATLTRWLAEDDKFREQYETALDIQRTVLADDVVSIADKGDDSKATDRKLRVDARKWRVRRDAEDKASCGGPPDDLAERLERASERVMEAVRRGDFDASLEDPSENEQEDESDSGI